MVKKIILNSCTICIMTIERYFRFYNKEKC